MKNSTRVKALLLAMASFMAAGCGTSDDTLVISFDETTSQATVVAATTSKTPSLALAFK